MSDIIQTIKDTCAVGAQRHGALLTKPVLCEVCDERPATITLDYYGAPIPNLPPLEHVCELCLDRRRDRAAEQASEDAP
jgi:hypothetical protein